MRVQYPISIAIDAAPQPFFSCLTKGTSSHTPEASAAQTSARKPAHQAGAGRFQTSTTADQRLGALDRIFDQAVAERQIPGAVVLVGHDGKVVFRKAYGDRSLEPRRETMTLDTIFDMASLTKCMATAVADAGSA